MRPPSECIPAAALFTRGATMPNGYWAWTRRQTVYGHRHVYEECFGPIPSGLQIHHTCEQRDCMNPEHFAVMGRLEHIDVHRATHCRRGHEMTPENTLRDPFPRCRICRNAQRRGAHRKGAI